MANKEKAAKVIRIVTAPPVLITVTLLVLWAMDQGVFESPLQLVLGIILLGAVPALAYPLQSAIPGLKDKGRDGQRKLAFALSLVGYAVGLATGLAGFATSKMLLIYLTYLISVILLTVTNKCFHEKASGHACSAAGSLGFAMLYIGPWAIVPSVVLYAAMAWSSIELKRHTPRNIATGTLVFALSLAIATLTMGFVR